MQKVLSESSVSSDDWEFYNVYLNSRNKESIEYLKWGMTLEEFSFYKEILDIQDAMEYEFIKESERKANLKGRKV